MPNISKLLSMAIIPLPVLTPTPTDITSVTTQPPESAPRRLIIDRDRVNIEIHQLIWLDANVKNDNDSAATMASVRKIIDYTKVFDNVEECAARVSTIDNLQMFSTYKKRVDT
ncbi:unnamed protein product [Didymodactylos carnosus]|uniref:Uncharacterized protein n=1 Tax=Didymodactylos carnosus TaxID=1234261 RepID=A0A8S2JDE5_9BILA|nr:unnamed protein product [Didymodactylos carnosus]CAF3794332.1 unnamed protein product [Didymodactylos carnosus]